MRPIELTRKRSGGESFRLFVNPDRIEFFYGTSGGSYVHFTSDASQSVTETPEQIVGRLADHRSTMRAEARDEIVTYRP